MCRWPRRSRALPPSWTASADDLPEWAFFNVGTLEDARQKAAEKMAEEKGGAV